MPKQSRYHLDGALNHDINHIADDNVAVKEKLEIFLGSLKNNPRSEDSHRAFNELVKKMSMKAAGRMKIIEKQEANTTDPEEKRRFATERLRINEELSQAVVEIGIMADRYHGNI